MTHQIKNATHEEKVFFELKNNLRMYFKQKRKLAFWCNDNARLECENRLLEQMQDASFPHFDAIAAYEPIWTEMPLNFSALAAAFEVPLYFPSVAGEENPTNRLSWYQWDATRKQLNRTAKGTLEPENISTFSFANRSEKTWLVLVPCLGVALGESCFGVRLGYGGGYYDRFFAENASHVIGIGIAFDDCAVEWLPKNTWDVPLAYVATEKRFLSPFVPVDEICKEETI